MDFLLSVGLLLRLVVGVVWCVCVDLCAFAVCACCAGSTRRRVRAVLRVARCAVCVCVMSAAHCVLCVVLCGLLRIVCCVLRSGFRAACGFVCEALRVVVLFVF